MIFKVQGSTRGQPIHWGEEAKLTGRAPNTSWKFSKEKRDCR
jgi:hypothetical protein